MTDDTPTRPFHERAAEYLQRKYKASHTAPKLSHEGKCQAYALLYNGARPDVVARMFGITRSTASYIAGCRNDDRKPTVIEIAGHSETIGGPQLAHRRNINRKVRYQEVAREYKSLGEYEFMARYLTRGVIQRSDAAWKEICAEYREKKGYRD